MSGLEAAGVALGGAVVKSACKIWLGDRALAADVSASAVDALAGRLTGVLERRRVGRLFEQMEEIVAERLAPLIEGEFRGLPDNERSAAVDAVRDTFDQAALTDEDLFAQDLDAGYLDRHLRRAAPDMLARAALSTDATELYGRLLRECCQYVVEITTALPRFQPGALTEVLRRETEIIAGLRELLARLPERRSAADFAGDYRRQVVVALDRMELFGATLSEASRRYPLSLAYISLSASSEGLSRAEPEPRRFDAFGSRGIDFRGLRGAGHTVMAPTVRVEDLLARTSRLLIRGQAGCGKTTLLRWLAVRCATGDLPEPLRDWAGAVPFLVPLRRYVDGELPGAEGFLGSVGRHIAEDKPPGWVRGLLESGRTVVLVDGVDELPEGRRDEAREWLRQLVEQFPAARYVVTSRPAAVAPDWLRREEFEVAELEPMTHADIRAFIRHWYEAARSDRVDERERAELAEYEARLLDAVADRHHLRRIAANPLLAALLCALHRDRRAQLPGDRMELYEIALQMLLERRDAERGIEVPPGLSRTEKMLLLQDIAYWLVRNGWSDADRDRVVDRLAAKLASMERVRSGAEEAYRHLVERSGLLREPVEGRTDFVHRSFQEYLAAKAAVEEDDLGVLVANAHLDQWQEVVVMAAGHAPRRAREELLTDLLARADAEEAHRDRLRLLAVACLETSPELSPKLHAEVERRVKSLLPPRTMAAATSLASAGAFVLDLLARTTPRSVRTVAATVRAAAEVGGEGALRLIARFGADDREAVRRELLAAWPRFDPEEYAERVLRDNGLDGGFLSVADPALLPGLRHLRHLRELRCDWRVAGRGDFGFVRELPELDWLIVLDPAVRDLRPLTERRIPEITLSFWGRETEDEPIDLSPLGEAGWLQSLWLLDCGLIKGLETLARLPELRSLVLDEVEMMVWTTPLRRLSHLSHLGLRRVTDLVDLGPLSFLEAPAVLDLGLCPNLADLAGIGQWAASLKVLHVRGCGVADLRPLTALPGLRMLNLGGNPVTDLYPLATLTELKYVGLARCDRVRDLSPLWQLPCVQEFHLPRMDDPIDLEPLRDRTGLTVWVPRGQPVRGGELLGEDSRLRRYS